MIEKDLLSKYNFTNNLNSNEYKSLIGTLQKNIYSMNSDQDKNNQCD